MTTPQLGSFESIPLSLIRPSGTNPRKHFDDLAMQELTRSVEEMGVTQPVLLRPRPKYASVEDIGVWKVYEYSPDGAVREPWIDLFEKRGLVEGVDVGREPAEKRAAELNAEDPYYELVSGERRYRAAKAAGRSVVPAIIRVLSDEEALEIQMIENLQRADLHPVEEAEGFRVLLHSGLDVEDVAKKSGKTVAHVQRLVKLLSLEVDAKQLFLDGHITLGHALLLARLTSADQSKAILFLINYHVDPKAGSEAVQRAVAGRTAALAKWDKGARFVEKTEAQLKDWIANNVLLQLFNAPWHLADAQLLPVAGACTDCPKRTGANTALFADITTDDDVCMDPACFAAKGAAQQKRQMTAAKESGTKLLKISAAASNAPLAAPAVQQIKGSTEVVTNQTVKQGQWVPAKEGECNSTVQAVVKDGVEKGALRWVCPDQKCKVHKHTVYQSYSSSPASSPKETPEQIAARELAAKRDHAVTLAVFQKIVDSWDIDTDALLREVIDVERYNIYGGYFPWGSVCEWLGVSVSIKKTEDAAGAAERSIREALPKMAYDDLFAVLFLLRNERLLDPDDANREALIKLAKANGVPKVLSVISDAERAWDKEHAPKPEAASVPAKSAAKKAAKKAAAKAGA